MIMKQNRNVIGWNAGITVRTPYMEKGKTVFLQIHMNDTHHTCKDEIDAMFLSCSDDKTGNVFDEVPTHQKDALDEMFIYFSENEPEISSEHLKLQSGARYSLKEGNTWHAVPKLGDFTMAFLNGSTNDDPWRNFAKF